MASSEHPCNGGLTPACFAAYPDWAKLAFAYKLLHTLFPPSITKRLPKGLFPGRIGPGALLPPGWEPPPGVIVPPDYTVPAEWIPFTYFILPPGLTWEEIFPHDWMVGDDLPAGVEINTNVVDVAGWSAGDPMPSGPGVNTAEILPAGWSPTNPPPAWFAPGGSGFAIPAGGVLPPLYLPPFEPGPPHRPSQQPVAKEEVTVTITSDASDGLVGNEPAIYSWDNLRNAASGTYIQNDKQSNTTIAGPYRGASYWSMVRGFYYFDLTGIPTAAKIISAKLEVSGNWQHNGNLCIQEGTQADPITINDFQAFTGNHFGWTAWASSYAAPFPRNSIDLNSAGETYLQSKFANIAKVCIREYDHDFLDVPIEIDDDYESGGFWAEALDEGDRPKLTVVYEI